MKIEIGTNEAGQRVDKFLRKWLKDVPLSAIYKDLRKGNIKVNGKKVKEKYSLQQGDIVELINVKFKNEKKNFKRVENSFLKITYEDENILALEKWPGVLVHANSKNGDATLTDYVLSYLHDKGDYLPENEVTFTPAACNRLDRNTSGIVLFGKNYESLKLLNEMIREKNIDKYYYALVKDRIKDGNYRAYIEKDSVNNKSKIYEGFKEGRKEIEMNVKTIQSCGTFSFVELELITGRSHQLRAHLSYLGNFIIGDNKYGDKKLNSFFANKYGMNYQYLYAYKLIFKNPIGKLEYMKNKIIVESIPPIFKKIKNDVFKF
ncbi:ribosomal large subunit pseudouridine synthase C [Clostridium acetireducens DSM 10703]|uniref:RNA pseudouridylate synthase n=1 Tax=Clostridium acetireducens DSM 10703 TaxID=1121290 RepID=A0A1E8EXS0_9CLOT|nr:RluA family pseudouridine synthase [Clostridium acetireducens]OFI05597.1 ribosomal large subunit pseudouridine synthase C [Clostridium acetireducens DSM 10703]